MKKQTQKNRKTQPALVLPPRPSLYMQHGLALLKAWEYLHCHFYTLQNLIPEEFWDGVAETEIASDWHELESQLREYLGRFSTFPQLDDETYMRNRRAQHGFVESREISILEIVGKAHDAWANWMDATAPAGEPPLSRRHKPVE